MIKGTEHLVNEWDLKEMLAREKQRIASLCFPFKEFKSAKKQAIENYTKHKKCLTDYEITENQTTRTFCILSAEDETITNKDFAKAKNRKYFIFEKKPLGESSNTVYLGLDLDQSKDQTPICIKSLKFHPHSNKDPQATFLNEKKILRRLTNIELKKNPYKGHYIESDKAFWLCYSCENGIKFSDLFYTKTDDGWTKKNLSPVFCFKIMLAISQALEYLHNIPMIYHRDLSPENILLDIDNNEQILARIFDFGLSCGLNEQTKSDYGTEGHISPEYLVKENERPYYGFPEEHYGLGITFFQMVSRFCFKNRVRDNNLAKEKLQSCDITNHAKSFPDIFQGFEFVWEPEGLRDQPQTGKIYFNKDLKDLAIYDFNNGNQPCNLSYTFKNANGEIIKDQLTLVFTKEFKLGCNLFSMNDLPKNRVPEKGKMYIEKQGERLHYVCIDPKGKPIDDFLDIKVEEINEKSLESIKYLMLKETSIRRHILKKPNQFELETLLELKPFILTQLKEKKHIENLVPINAMLQNHPKLEFWLAMLIHENRNNRGGTQKIQRFNNWLTNAINDNKTNEIIFENIPNEIVELDSLEMGVQDSCSYSLKFNRHKLSDSGSRPHSPQSASSGGLIVIGKKMSPRNDRSSSTSNSISSPRSNSSTHHFSAPMEIASSASPDTSEKIEIKDNKDENKTDKVKKKGRSGSFSLPSFYSHSSSQSNMEISSPENSEKNESKDKTNGNKKNNTRHRSGSLSFGNGSS